MMADIPGLIKGAATGAGLGHRFLKHISRCRLLLHCVDPMDTEQSMLDRIETIQKELAAYGSETMEKEQMIVLTKMDCLTAEQQKHCIQEVKQALSRQARSDPQVFDVVGVSAHEKIGLDDLKQRIASKLYSSDS